MKSTPYITACKACGRPITFIKTPAGKYMPVEKYQALYQTRENGPDVLVDRYGKTFKAKIVKSTDPADGIAWVPHWGRCPGANRLKHASRLVKTAREKKAAEPPAGECEQLTLAGALFGGGGRPCRAVT